MEMTKISNDEIIVDILRKLFISSTPAANYDELKSTDFKNHYISILAYHTIVEEFLEGKKFTNLRKSAIRSKLNLSKNLPKIKRL
jgi:hypothetical protein